MKKRIPIIAGSVKVGDFLGTSQLGTDYYVKNLGKVFKHTITEKVAKYFPELADRIGDDDNFQYAYIISKRSPLICEPFTEKETSQNYCPVGGYLDDYYD